VLTPSSPEVCFAAGVKPIHNPAHLYRRARRRLVRVRVCDRERVMVRVKVTL
jgi:hypothetical protein